MQAAALSCRALQQLLWFRAGCRHVVIYEVACAAYVLGRQKEQYAPEEASDSLDIPSSPAPSEYGSQTSSLSRLRYVLSTDLLFIMDP